MEQSLEQQYKKRLRRSFGVVGWTLLIYYGIMNVSVFLTAFAQMLERAVQMVIYDDFGAMNDLTRQASESAWGYFLAIAIGFVILMCWKKKRFWKEQIWAHGKPMTVPRFFAILSVFLSGQMIYQILVMVSETVLNIFGLSMMEGLEALSVDSDHFGMFLYAGILAPIAEEILFRGLIQRTLLPYGKRFAILCSAFTFGIFHGNLLQSPYAFLVGLVLGYTAAEYSIAWSMVLHMINNLVIADLLNRLTAGLSDIGAAVVVWGILLSFSIAALAVVIVNRKAIRSYGGRLNRLYVKCFFSSPGMIVLMILMGLSMIYSAFLMIGPIY